MGVSGIVLNSIVLVGVAGNARLGTTINKLLIWSGILRPCQLYRVFHRFREAKFDNGGSILSWSQFSPLPQLPQKMKLTSKVVKIDSK
jgi:hypothetical protein